MGGDGSAVATRTVGSPAIPIFDNGGPIVAWVLLLYVITPK